MLISYKEALHKYGSAYQINKAVQRREIFKIKKGLYSNEIYRDEEKELFKKFNNIVMTLQSAFYYHGVSDYIPDFIYVATPKSSYPINNKNVKQIFMSDHYLNIGIDEIQKEGFAIKVFDFERTLIELIRYENKLPYEEYMHVLKKYREKSNQLNVKKFIDYAKKFRYSKKILNIVETVIL
jgi:predicted transcriptional regulator of viral defense system